MDQEGRRVGGSGFGVPSPVAVQAVRRLQIVAGAMALGVALGLVVLLLLNASGSLAGIAAGGEGAPMVGGLVVLAAVLLVAAPVVERFLVSRQGASEPVQRYQTAKVVSLALRETVGLLGFVVGLFSGSLLWAASLAAASLLAIAIAWPRERDLASGPADLPPPQGLADPG